MSFRTACVAFFAALFLRFPACLLSQEEVSMPAEYYYHPACLLQTSGCTEWETRYVGVHLPEYPGCELTFVYRTRSCPDLGTGSPHPIEEIIVDYIAWPTPATWPSPGDPCSSIHGAYLGTPLGSRVKFLRVLFQEVVVTRFRNRFDLEYERDSVLAVVDPGNQTFQDNYMFRLCGNGKKTYRVINGLCMAAITKPDVPFSGVFGRAEREDEKGTSIAGDPPHSATNYMRVRYVPCEALSDVPCCVQLLQFCRNPYTWETDLTVMGTIMGEPSACSTSVPVVGPLESGESTQGCSDYCLDYEPEYRMRGQGEGNPDLSGPIERSVPFVKEGMYEGGDTISR